MRGHISDAAARVLAEAEADDGMDLQESIPLPDEGIERPRGQGQPGKNRRSVSAGGSPPISALPEPAAVRGPSWSEQQELARRIIRIVAEVRQVPETWLVGRGRGSAIVFARQIAMYLIFTRVVPSYLKTSSVFGRSDHATARHAHVKIRELRRADASFAAELAAIEARITSLVAESTAGALRGDGVSVAPAYHDARVLLDKAARLALLRARVRAYKARQARLLSLATRLEAADEGGEETAPRSLSLWSSFGRDNTIPRLLSMGKIFAILASRTSTVSGERVVAGAVSLLAAELLVEPSEALRILEEMQRARYLEPRDEWRAVVLRALRVKDGEIRVRVLRGRRRRAVPGRPDPELAHVLARRHRAAVARRSLSPAALLTQTLSSIEDDLAHVRRIYPDHPKAGAIEARFTRIRNEWTEHRGDPCYAIGLLVRCANQLLVDLFLLRRGAGR